MAEPPPLRTITAVFPGATQPRRGHFIENLHAHLGGEFSQEILAPQVFPSDSLQEARDGIEVRRFPYRSRHRLPRQGSMSPFAILSYLRSALRAARTWWPRGDEARGGCVLGHWILPSGWVAARVAARLRVPLILYAHGSDLHHYGARGLPRCAVGKLIRNASRTVVVSDDLAERAAQASGRAQDDFPVIPMGIDSQFVAPRPSPEHSERLSARKRGELKVLFVGDLIRSKGLPAVLRAFRQAQASHPNLQLEVIGDGPLAPEVESVGKGVRWQPNASASEVAAAMNRAHLLALPSEREGTPLVIQEATATGLPVAATPVGGIPQFFARPENRTPGWHELRLDQPEESLTSLLQQLAQESLEALADRETKLAGSARTDLAMSQRAEDLREVVREAVS